MSEELTPGQQWRADAKCFDLDTNEINRCAKKMYMRNWRELPNGHFPPIWENTSEEVRDWMRNQVVGAMLP